jgi:signal transduction histidine kinase
MATPDRALERTVRDVFESSALRGERVLSVVRALFCVLVGVRYAWVTSLFPMPENTARAWVTYPALAAAIVFSAAVYLRWWHARVASLLHWSVAMDAVICFVTLLPNVLWPGPGYLGIANMADATAIMGITLVAGLRYSTSAAILGALLNGCSYVTLIVLELHRRGNAVPLASHMYLSFGIYLAGVAAMAVAMAAASRRLALRAAEAAVHADFAGRSLGELLREHHDARALVSAARIHAELLARELERPSPHGAQLPTIAEDLRADLEALHTMVDDIKQRAYTDLLAMEKAQIVDVVEVLGEITSLLGDRYPSVTVRARAEGRPRAWVAGGRSALRRALFNLVVNACEGDGARVARAVEVEAIVDARGVRIEILDDGPGFPASSLHAGAPPWPSTKPSGSGMGLAVASAIALASTGSIDLSNRESGGGRVTVSLRAAD